jgi:hypothetical protein
MVRIINRTVRLAASKRLRLAIYLPARKTAWLLGVPCRPRCAIWTRRISAQGAIGHLPLLFLRWEDRLLQVLSFSFCSFRCI